MPAFDRNSGGESVGPDNLGPAPRGPKRLCRSWQTEAAYRMLLNNLDPEIAEDPAHLVVYGGSGRAARSWEAVRAILKALRELADDETLLVQSGKPVGIFRTHAHSPRVLLANSHLVPAWANWDEFRRLEQLGLTMFGQMTAGSWIYIGTQGILQGTYETFIAAGKKHFNGQLAGRLICSGGLGGMGGAQPLAATLAGAVFLGADVDRRSIEKRLKTRYLHQVEEDLDRAIDQAASARDRHEAVSIAWPGNIIDLLDRLQRRGVLPDLLTDQTSAHDPLNGYVPAHQTYEAALALRRNDPQSYQRAALDTMVEHIALLLNFQKKGVACFDYGNNLRGNALAHGAKDAFAIPGFIPEYIRPLFCEGKGPFRWVALSGDPLDIERTDRVILEEFSENQPLCNWIRMAQEHVAFQGLPARICWLGYGERARFGRRINELVARGELSAPIVIGRDHLDCGSVASPNRETEKMRDGSDAIADWPLLNALLNTASGATWVSLHHGGGVGIGQSIHAGMVVVADGTEECAQRLERVLTSDPGIGIVRHADAGYETALESAKRFGIKLPFRSRNMMTSAKIPVERCVFAKQVVTLSASGPEENARLEPRRGDAMSEVGAIADGGLAVDRGKIVAVAARQDLEARYVADHVEEYPASCLTPGLIDCHTHLVFAEDRVDEFYARIAGVSYQELARQGGGIRLSVKHLRRASKAQLTEAALERLAQLLQHGTTTCEIKSGYGLNLQDEVKTLEVIQELRKQQPVDLVATFLGAHEVPDEYQKNREAYIKLICDEMIPHVVRERLARFCDVFCEAGVFSLEESEQVLTCARSHGLGLKLHADELAENFGGAELAARLNATSADHLVRISPQGINALAQAGTVAVLLPATSFFLGKEVYAPARALIQAKVPVALATDLNPGSSNTENIQAVMTLAALKLKMSAEEILTAVTHNAACAIGESARVGRLEPGLQGDFVVWNLDDYRKIPYHFGGNRVRTVYKAGAKVWAPSRPF